MEEEKQSSLKASLTVVATGDFIAMTSKDVMITISRNAGSRADGVSFGVGVSFKDLNEESLTKKLLKKDWSKAKIEKELTVRRKALTELYKTEALDKLESLGLPKPILDEVSKELKEGVLLPLLR